MVHPLFSLGCYFWRTILPVAALSVVLVFFDALYIGEGAYDPLLWFFLFLPVVLLMCPLWLWVGRMAGRVWRFRSATSPRLVLHYDPGLEDRWDFSVLLQRFESEVDDLTKRFGFRLGGRTAVFLFASPRDIARIFAQPITGIAPRFAKFVCVADDVDPNSIFRHELCHVFADHWNLLAPPLLGEGLATWLQYSGKEACLQRRARVVLHVRGWRLSALLSLPFFFSPGNRPDCYALAGSFTGFLIQRFGWDNYCRFYRAVRVFRFKTKFKRHFGVTLEEAEQQWRTHLESATSGSGSSARQALGGAPGPNRIWSPRDLA